MGNPSDPIPETKDCTRSRISPAALFVNVTAITAHPGDVVGAHQMGDSMGNDASFTTSGTS